MTCQCALTFGYNGIFFRYEENNLKVGKKKTNLMFIGDGKGKTVITGKKNVVDGMTTFHTASFGEFLSTCHVCQLVSLEIHYFMSLLHKIHRMVLFFFVNLAFWKINNEEKQWTNTMSMHDIRTA